MTKKILVPLLVAPLILAGCGNNKKALKPFEKGDNLLTAELVRALLGESEETKLSISEEKFTAPEGWTEPTIKANTFGMDFWATGTGDDLVYHVVSLLTNKEIASVPVNSSLLDYDLVEFTNFDLGFGYCYAVSTEGTGDDLVYKFKAVDAYGNVLVDWSGKDDSEMPGFTDFVYESDYGDFYCLKFTQWKDNHYDVSFKVYAEDFSSLEDIEYLPGSGEEISYVDQEFEKDGKNYRVELDEDHNEFSIYQVSDKGDKLVKTLALPDRDYWSLIEYSEYSYIVITDRVVADDAEEWTYLAPLGFSGEFSGQGDTEGDFGGNFDVSVPGLVEKHLQEVHVIDLYNMEQSVTASPYAIDMLRGLGFEDLDIDEEVLADPYLFLVGYSDVDERGYVREESYHYYIVDDNFGFHDELNEARLYTAMSASLPALAAYAPAPLGENYYFEDDYGYGYILDENLNIKKSLSSSFTVEGSVGDHLIVSVDDFDDTEVYALADSEGKLVTGFDFSAISPIDDTHFMVYDHEDSGMGYLDLGTGSVNWLNMAEYITWEHDAIFTYVPKGEGDDLKFDAMFNGIIYKEVGNDGAGHPAFLAPTADAIYQVQDPLGEYIKIGVKELREGSTDVYDIHWFVITGMNMMMP